MIYIMLYIMLQIPRCSSWSKRSRRAPHPTVPTPCLDTKVEALRVVYEEKAQQGRCSSLARVLNTSFNAGRSFAMISTQPLTPNTNSLTCSISRLVCANKRATSA